MDRIWHATDHTRSTTVSSYKPTLVKVDKRTAMVYSSRLTRRPMNVGHGEKKFFPQSIATYDIVACDAIVLARCKKGKKKRRMKK